MSDIKVGSRVRLKDPDGFLVEYQKKTKDRVAIVESIQDLSHYGWKETYYWIVWQKRGNRGKEFRHRHQLKDLEVAE